VKAERGEQWHDIYYLVLPVFDAEGQWAVFVTTLPDNIIVLNFERSYGTVRIQSESESVVDSIRSVCTSSAWAGSIE
jgi:hypothetical protein